MSAEHAKAGAGAWYETALRRLGIQFLVNSTSSVAARAMSGGVRVGILLALARAYGPQSFGKVSLAISVVEILRTFSEFGVDTVSLRRFAQLNPEERSSLLKEIIGAKLFLAACFYFIGSMALLLIAGEEVVLYSLIAGLSLFFGGVVGAFSSYLQSFFSMSRMFKTTLTGCAISVGFAVCAIYFKAPVLLVITALPLADVVNLLLICRRSDPPLRATLDLKSALSLLRESLPVGLMAVIVIVYFRLDNLFVFKFAGGVALGLYAACYRVVEPALMIPQAFSTTAFTLLSGPEREKDGMRHLVGAILRVMWPAYAWVTVIASVIILGGKPFLSGFLPAYSSAYPIFLVLAVTLMARSVNVLLTAVVNSRGRYWTVTKICVANLAINLVLVLFLVPKHGAVGAAWAALLTEMLNMIMQGRIAFSLLRVSSARLTLSGASFGEM
jgi:O-antigen/teichoic acid export membrane protein